MMPSGSGKTPVLFLVLLGGDYVLSTHVYYGPQLPVLPNMAFSFVCSLFFLLYSEQVG